MCKTGILAYAVKTKKNVSKCAMSDKSKMFV